MTRYSSLYLIENKLTTVSGEIINQLTTTSGDIVAQITASGVSEAWVLSQDYATVSDLLTVSGYLITYINELPSGEVTYAQLVSTSGSLVADLSMQVTTTSGYLIEYIDNSIGNIDCGTF